jgi:nitroreductase
MTTITNDAKTAQTTYDIHDLITRRYSPYVFDPERSVSADDLAALFEAASWAANSYNEQPWRYIVATRDDTEAFETLWSCLSKGNQGWTKDASVLALGVYKTHFSHNDSPNRSALHDLGAAAANLTLEATRRGMVVHQMAGILPDRARTVYNIPEGFEVATAIAIGYEGDLDSADETMRERDSKPRTRKPLEEFVFAGSWEEPAFD